ncbi:MAG TPA: hypothetical protein VL475_06815 [Planctomycetaceae bacterium]|nr:hypothetical protein [Planctomycetaceae bacterium]
MQRFTLATALTVALLGTGNLAQAGFIVNTSGAFFDSNLVNPGANDHVTFNASSVDVTVPLGTTVTAELQTGLFQNNYSFIPDQDFAFNVTETVSVGSFSALLTIPGMIRITGPGDTLFTYTSAPTNIDLGNGTILTIVANPVTVPLWLGDAPFTLTADFTLSPSLNPNVATPAPSSLVMLTTLGMTVFGIRSFRRKRHAALTAA